MDILNKKLPAYRNDKQAAFLRIKTGKNSRKLYDINEKNIVISL